MQAHSSRCAALGKVVNPCASILLQHRCNDKVTVKMRVQSVVSNTFAHIIPKSFQLCAPLNVFC